MKCTQIENIFQKTSSSSNSDLDEERKKLARERIELELIKRKLERKMKEADNTEVSVDPYKDEEYYKPKKRKEKSQFEKDFETRWKEKFGESYNGGKQKDVQFLTFQMPNIYKDVYEICRVKIFN